MAIERCRIRANGVFNAYDHLKGNIFEIVFSSFSSQRPELFGVDEMIYHYGMGGQ